MPDKPPTRILIVEDDPASADLVGRALGGRGYIVVTAKDGVEGLALLERSRPDLVVSDVQMPRMNGWDFVRRLRARPETAFTPVIFLTALDSVEDCVYGFRLGADDYLSKPYAIAELVARVERLLARARNLHGETRKALEAPGGLQGTLGETGLASILLLLEMEKKSCVVKMERDGDTGTVYLWKGRVTSASCGGSQKLQGEEAVYRLLRWSDGRFRTEPLDMPLPPDIKRTTTELITEAARRFDKEARRN